MRRFSLVLWCALLACGDDDATPTDAGARRDAATEDAGRAETNDAGTDGGEMSEDDAGSDAGTAARARTMWITVGGEARLAVATLEADGTMTARFDDDLTLPGDPGPMTYARAARRLHVGVRPSDVATVALDADGVPSLLGTSPVGDFPVYVATARDEAVLVAAYFGADALRSFTTTEPPFDRVSDLGVDDEPHAATVHAGRVYVPHRNGQRTQWFDVAEDGALSLGGELPGPEGAGPRHIAFTPDGAHAYVVNEYTDSVSAHTVGSDGALERFQTLSTLPEGTDGSDNTCADIHVTPDGRFVYASNRGHDSLAMFAVGDGGTLSFLGTVPTEARPREFDLSPDGRFVVAAGQDSGALQSYRVEDDGTLTSIDRLEVGANLLWVVID